MEIEGPIIVTGSSGFVGRALAARLGASFEALHFAAGDWRRRVESIDFRSATIFHLAARVHRRGERDDDAAYRADNVEKTRVLAETAARQGARRLVFLSSIKVNGEETRERPFRRDDPPRPGDAYARSKRDAERALAEVAERAPLERVVVRSPLVYGPGAGGNLRALMRLADTPWPLPFGAIENRRSFVHVDDLARLLVACGAHARPAPLYLAANMASVPSTGRIVSLMRAALGRPARLVRIPTAVLETMGSLGGQGARVKRLTRSLEVDASDAQRELGWNAAVDIEESIEQMAAAYGLEKAR